MSCALTTAYSLDCRDSIGGVKKIYFGVWSANTSWTITTGTVTAIVTGAPTFYGYQQEIETANWAEQIQTNRANGTLFYEQDVTAILYKMQATLRNEIYLLAQNRLVIIVLDENGKYFMLGRQRGAMMEPSTSGSGTARGDRNGYELKFKAKEPLPAEEVSSSVVSTLGLT